MRVKIAKCFWDSNSPNTLQLYLEQSKLVRQNLALLGFFPISNICRINDQCSFDCTSGISSDILINVLEDCIVCIIWAIRSYLIFILSRNKGFQSEALLKMPTSSSTVEEFGLDFQKYF